MRGFHRSPRFHDALAGLLLLFLVLVLFGHVLNASDRLFYGDHDLVFRPRWRSIVDALSNGRWPARTWASTSGTPLEYMLNATYTPPALLFALGSFDAAYDWVVASHVLILAIGAYVLARSYAVRPHEAVLVAFVAFLGPLVSFENLLVGLAGFAYLPWALWAFRRILLEPSPGYVAALAFAGGFHVQGIMPETALLDIVACGFVLATTSCHARGRATVATLVGVALGFAIASIELMPVLESLTSSDRGRGFGSKQQVSWSMHPAHIVRWMAPGVLELPDVPTIVRPGVGSPRRTYLASLYLSWMPELAIAALFGRRSRRIVWALIFALGFFALMALGSNGPLYEYVSQLPVLRSGRFPVKYTVHVAFAVAALAVLGLRAIEDRPKLLLALLGFRIVALTVAVVTLMSPEAHDYLKSWIWSSAGAYFTGVPPEWHADLLVNSVMHRVVHALIGVTVAFIVVAVVVRRGRAGAFAVVLVAVLGLDLVLGARLGILGVPVEPSESPTLTSAVASPYYRYYVLETSRKPVPTNVEHPDAPLADQAVNRRLRVAPHISARRFFDYNADAQGSKGGSEIFSLLFHTSGPTYDRVLVRGGVHQLSTWLRLDRPGIEVPIEGQVPQFVYPLDSPRAYVEAYPAWISFDDLPTEPRARAATLTSDEGMKTAVVYRIDVAGTASSTSAAAMCRASTIVRWAAPEEDRIEAEIDSPCAQLVVVLEAYAGGWRATLDGDDTKVLEAEAGFIAAAVPAGHHTLHFVYQPILTEWVSMSLAAGALALLLLCWQVLTVIARRRTSHRNMRNE